MACDYDAGVVAVCRTEAKCKADWPADDDRSIGGACPGPDEIRCCKAKCQLKYGPWSGACAACNGALETRTVEIDTQGLSMANCPAAVVSRPCMLTCRANTNTSTLSTRTTTTAPPKITLTLPSVPFSPATTTTTTTTTTMTTTTPTTMPTTTTIAAALGVEAWVIGAAAGGGALVVICLVVVIVLLVRKSKKKRYAAQVDNDTALPLHIGTYASPDARQSYDVVPPEDALVENALQSRPSYTNHGLKTDIVYDGSIPMTASELPTATSTVGGNRFSAVPKF
jgi:cell division septation protein DedD